MVDGVLYTTGGSRRAVTALDAATGEQLWVFSLNEGERGAEAPRRLSGRGLAFWQRGNDKRVLYVTPGYQLIALNAQTGRPIEGFGEGGIVDLWKTLDQGDDWDTSQIGTHSPPTIANDVVIVAAAHTPLAPADQAEQRHRLHPRLRRRDREAALDVPHRAAARRAGLRDVAQRLGRDGQAGNAGVWATISADEELGLAYLPVESPYGDMYGGLRPGANLYGESIVAVDLRTGERRWHFQTSHHPLWDYDIPTAPILVDAVKDGKKIKALAQATKQGLLFVLNRETGEPIWPIEETRRAAGQRAGRVVLADPADSDDSLRASGCSASMTSSISRPSCGPRPSASWRNTGSARSTRRPCRSTRTARSARSWSWAAATGPAALTIPRRTSSMSPRASA